MFERALPETQTTVTPREINQLVNAIAALFLQWRDEVAVEVMAVYVIRRKQIEQNLLRFLQSFEADIAREISNWKLQLAALHYGVPVDKAAQVMFEQPIRNAIVAFDQEAFGTLAKTDGFGDTFEFVTANLPIDPEDETTSFRILSNAALLLASLETDDAMWKETAWSNLTEQLLTMGGPDQATEDLSLRLKCLMEHVSPGQYETFAETCADRLSALLSKKGLNPKNLDATQDAAVALLEFAAKHSLETPEFTIGPDAATFLNRVSAARWKHKLWPQLRGEFDAEQIVETLRGMLISKVDQGTVPGAIDVLTTSAGDDIYGGDTLIVWTPLAQLAAEVVRNPDQHGVKAGVAIQSLAFMMRRQSEAETLLTALADEEVVAQRMSTAAEETDWDELFTMLAVLIWRGKRFGAPANSNWSYLLGAKSDLPQRTLLRMRTFFGGKTMPLVWEASRANYNNHPLLEAIIRHMVEKGDLGEINLKQILNELPRYRDAVPWRLRTRFMDLLVAKGSFWSQLEAAPMGQPLHLATVALSKKSPQHEDRVREIVERRIKGATKEEWKVALLSGDQPFEMATELAVSHDFRLGRDSALFGTLADHIDFMARAADRHVRARWFGLLALFHLRQARGLMKALAEALLAAPPRQALHVLKAGGKEMLKAAAYGANPRVAVENIVLKQMRTKDGREWLKDNQQEVRGWVQRSSDETQAAVAWVLRRDKNSKSEERRYDAEVLASSWGLSEVA
jgi:hypothetical protein